MIIGYAVSMCKLLYKCGACDKLPSINACRCAQTYKSVYTAIVVGMVLIKNEERDMDIQEIHYEAKCAAYKAAFDSFHNEWEGRECGSCGFAWCEIYSKDGKKIRANSKLGKALAQAGIEKNWEGVHMFWRPGDFPTQNIDVLEKGARAYAQVFRDHGFQAYAASRLD